MPEKIAGAGRKWLLLANKSFSAGFFIAQPAERRGKGEKTMRMDMTMVYRFGDGTLLCEECFRREYPNKELPIYGWELGRCSTCREVEETDNTQGDN